LGITVVIFFYKGGKKMWLVIRGFAAILIVLLVSITGLSFARTLTAVGLYSETEEGAHVSYRVGSGNWVRIYVGNKIPGDAEIKVSVDRDWVEVIPSDNPNKVYEIDGSDKGDVVKKVQILLKEKGKTVVFPKVSKNTDPAFKNKLVVKEYLGRQIYIAPDGSENDIKYGDRLDIKGKVNIIAINTTLKLVYPNGMVTNVIGPIKFDVEKLFSGQNIYKYLNVTK
jgi:hypothetical protein